MIDLICPTVTGREESLIRCLDSFNGVNPIVIHDAPNCGTGWLWGMEQSRADYVVLCCDDIEAAGDEWRNVAIETIDKGMLPAPIIRRPNGTVESAGGDMNAAACLLSEVQADWTPVGFTPLPILGRKQLERIGMIPSHLMTDVWVSYRGRQLGYETVLRHDYRLIHHHETVGRIYGSDLDDRRIFSEAMASV